jgi:hypothetical protein
MIKDTLAKSKGMVSTKEPAIKSLPKLKIFSVYASFNPSLITSSDILTADTKTHKSYSKLKSDAEKMKRAMGFDFGILFSPFHKLSIATGLVYEKRIETVNYQFKRNEVPVLDSSTGEIFGYVLLSDSAAEKVNYSNSNTYSYIGIPVFINYNVLQLRKFGIGLQINGSYLRQTSLHGKTINSTSLKLEDLNALNSTQLKSVFNAGLGMNFSYALSKNCIINITPKFKKQVNKNIKTSAPKQTSLTIGFQYFII